MLPKSPVDAVLKDQILAYRAQLQMFSEAHEGEYVVLRTDKPLGFYPSYEVALEAGYEQYGLDPFLVKRVCLHEEPENLPIYISSHAQREDFASDQPAVRRVAARGGQ